MIEGVSSSSLIAAAFGPGAVRRAGPAQGPAFAQGAGGLQPIEEIAYPQPQDWVELSHEADSTRPPADPLHPDAKQNVSRSRAAENAKDPGSPSDTAAINEDSLSEEDQEKVKKLKERDAEVRRHEQAHIAAGGQYVQGGAQYEYENGPDGKQYATGGEVGIDTSEVPDDPAATIRKMQVVRRAALAPSEPSAADRRIAAEAQQKETQARAELQAQQAEEAQSGSANGPARPTGAPSDDNANAATENSSAKNAEVDAASAATSPAQSFVSILAGQQAKPVWLQAGARQADRKPAPPAFVQRASTPIGTAIAARSYAAVAFAGKRMSTLA
ncbi:MAG: hypothetical protein JXB13_00340 [Phycisphaerae bacterium]|nr:hypothetical protein [Phycisphaerae bacterium]